MRCCEQHSGLILQSIVAQLTAKLCSSIAQLTQNDRFTYASRTEDIYIWSVQQDISKRHLIQVFHGVKTLPSISEYLPSIRKSTSEKQQGSQAMLYIVLEIVFYIVLLREADKSIIETLN